MLKFDQVKTALENLPYDDLVAIYNDCYNDDDIIYYADEMDEILCNCTVTQIANMTYFGDYNPSYGWFTFDGYGNIRSIFSPLDEIDLDCLAEIVIDNPDLHHYIS